MADRPSLLNLDQAQSEMQNLQGQMSSQISNFENQTIQQTKTVINEISKQIQNLQNSLSSQDMMGPLKQQLDETISMFKKFQEVGQQAITSQKYEVEAFTNNISQIYEAIKKSQDAIQQFNSIPVGNVQQINEFERSISNLKTSFEDFISTSDIINIEQSDLDVIRQRIMNFMKDLSNEGSKAFNIAESMTQASQDPALKSALTNMLNPLNEAIAQIPSNVIDSFTKTQNQISGGSSSNIIEELISSLNSFSGTIQSQTSNSVTNYDPVLAQQNSNKRQEENVKASEEATANTTARLSEHFDKMLSASHYASNIDSNINKIENDSVKLDLDIEKLLNSLGEYSKQDLSQLTDIGMGEEKLSGLKDDVGEIQKLLSNYKLKSDGSTNAINDYKAAGSNFTRNSSPENLLKLIESEQKVKEEAEKAAMALEELCGFTSKYVTELDIDSETFEKLPNEMKDVLLGMNDIFVANLQSGNDLLKLYEAFGINIDNIGENLKKSMDDAKDAVDEMNDKLSEGASNASNKFSSMFNMFSKVSGGIISGVTGYYKELDKLGLNPGIPTDVNGIYRYIRGGTEWYQKFGQMNYQGALAQIAQGGPIDDEALYNYKQTGKELYRMSYGQITNEDYYNTLTKLLTQVQGQYGGDNASGRYDLEGMSKMAVMMEKVYGVDSINMINTFYKELNLSADETNSILSKLVSTAEMANIPVSQYIKTIGELSVKFKDLGIDVKLVENSMRTLTMEGMSFSTAQGLTADMGNAINKFTDNPGQMAVFGMLSGQFSNPWEAMWKMSDRWDENGNVKPEATQSIISSIGTHLDYITKMSSGNEYAQRLMMATTLQRDYGLTEDNAHILTNKYMSGDYDSFGQMLEKYLLEDDDTKSDNLEAELQDKIVNATERLDELTKAESIVSASQQDLADKMKNFYDILLNDMKGSIDSLTGSMNDLAGKIANSNFGEDLAHSLNWLGPTTGGIIGLISSLFGGNILKGGFNRIFKGKTSKKGSKGSKGGKGKVTKNTTNVADDTVNAMVNGTDAVTNTTDNATTTLANNTDDITSTMTNTADDAAKTIANNADDVVKTIVNSADDATKTVANGADDVVKTMANNADDVTQTITNNADDVVKTIANNADDVTKTVANGADDAVKTIASGADDAVKIVANGADDIIRTTSKGVLDTVLGTASKVASPIATLLTGIFAFNDAKKEGKGTNQALVEAGGSAVGSGLGGWAGASSGAAAGSMFGPWGTLIGALIGGFGGGWLGEKVGNKGGEYLYDIFAEDDKKRTSSISFSDTTAGQKLLKDVENATKDGNVQTNKNLKDQISILSVISDETNKTTKNIDILAGKTETVERTMNKTSDKLLDVLKNDGIKVKTLPSLGSYGSGSGTGSGTGSGDSGITLTNPRNELLNTLNNYKDNKNNNTGGGSGGSGGTRTWSTSDVAKLTVDDAIHKKLNEKTNLTASDINDWIASKTGSNSKMRGMGDAFIKASQESGLDPLYLVAHAALETGWGTSSILKNKNNWFGIGAFDSSPYESAYGFSNLEAGIIEGAKWISKNYTQDGQETLWKMVNDPEGWHNYATDPEWARKIASIMITGAGGNGSYSKWTGTTGASGGSGSGSGSGSGTGTYTKSFEDLAKENTFSSTIFKIGSPEWSNKGATYDINSYKDYDFGENSAYVYRDSQAMARNTYLSSCQDDVYKSTIEAYDDKSSAYNQNPQFNIDINVNGSGNYEAMANEMKTALSNIALQYMGSSAKIASANYYRANSQF